MRKANTDKDRGIRLKIHNTSRGSGSDSGQEFSLASPLFLNDLVTEATEYGYSKEQTTELYQHERAKFKEAGLYNHKLAYENTLKFIKENKPSVIGRHYGVK